MNILICGAGQVGSHAAQVLSAMGHNITVIDQSKARIQFIEENMDVSTLEGNCTHAESLTEALVHKADLVIAATSNDEINILTAAVAKKLGADRTMARVHHGAYFRPDGMDYRKAFDIEELICPDFATAQAIASVIRNPGALAVEGFAQGQVQMQEVEVVKGATADGKKLIELTLPAGVRIASVTRGDESFVPTAQTELKAEDHAIVVADADIMRKAVKLFEKKRSSRLNIAIMGGSSEAVWLCKALHHGEYVIRLFEMDREKAEQLAEEMDWITVIHADPTDHTIFVEEGLSEVDAFVALASDRDDYNMLSCAYAKSHGVKTVISVLHRPDYMHLVRPVGIDHVFTPRMLAMRDIFGILDRGALTNLASLAGGQINVYRARVMPGSRIEDLPLRDLKLKPNWVIAAIQHEGRAKVPGGNDKLQAGDTALVIGQDVDQLELNDVFAGK